MCQLMNSIDKKREDDEGAEELECWVRVAVCNIKKNAQNISLPD